MNDYEDFFSEKLRIMFAYFEAKVKQKINLKTKYFKNLNKFSHYSPRSFEKSLEIFWESLKIFKKIIQYILI